MLKKETNEGLKIAKEKNETHEGSKVLKRNKDSPYFQGNYQKGKVMIKGVQKYLGLGKYYTHLHFLIKVYDLHLLEVRFLT